ncbi:hypothetical protein K458DRAFT_403538 [Lentithecium fluviatile CBS 122367]|uniref:Uncharacterized protein n=1 Tax=Lentithecium fluviatile CBS 122367 TaxID=1168545 RepID=A0A6G1J533_9PLEO|nr:hypothetical protein K458DRAFT_403538 [Lentithecium fluviatile CBS 122367]
MPPASSTDPTVHAYEGWGDGACIEFANPLFKAPDYTSIVTVTETVAATEAKPKTEVEKASTALDTIKSTAGRQTSSATTAATGRATGIGGLKGFDWPRSSNRGKQARGKTTEEIYADLEALRSLASSHSNSLSPRAPSTLSTHFIPTLSTTISTTPFPDHRRPHPPEHTSHNAATLRYRPLLGRSHPRLGMGSVGGEFDLPAFPPALLVGLYICLGLGSVWVVLVWLVDFPPHTWNEDGSAKARNSRKTLEGKGKEKRKKNLEGKANGKWWKWIVPGAKGRGRGSVKKKPVDKPSKYALLNSGSSTPSSTSPSASSDSGSSASDSPSTKLIIENGKGMAATSVTPTPTLRKRNPATHAAQQQQKEEEDGYEPTSLSRPSSQLPVSVAMPPWRRNLPRLQRHHTQNPPTSASPSSTTSTTSTPQSPPNPYLPSPPLQSRSSTEYLLAHNAFFSSTSPTHSCPSSTTPSPSLSPSRSSSNLSYEDVDALEAQMELPSHRRVNSEVYLAPNNGGAFGRGGNKKRWNGVNVLDAVDGAVSRGVDKLVKWAVDDGGDEGLVLPYAGARGGEED